VTQRHPRGVDLRRRRAADERDQVRVHVDRRARRGDHELRVAAEVGEGGDVRLVVEVLREGLGVGAQTHERRRVDEHELERRVVVERPGDALPEDRLGVGGAQGVGQRGA